MDMNDGHMGMPVVDVTKQPEAVIGSSTLNIGVATYSTGSTGEGEGNFRLNCKFSHMANNDPIVYPNIEGASHHHTFVGNTAVNHASDLDNLDDFGNSTCSGGIANRSAYWFPSMIDTSTNTPLKPSFIGVYYKTQRLADVTVPPKGLRIIARPEGFYYMCNEDWPSRTSDITSCGAGGDLRYGVDFPMCWDGINLDSEDHMSHMAYVGWSDACPASHNVRIPNITINVMYDVTDSAGTANWRLASDMNGMPSGHSLHADWVEGWDDAVVATFVEHCLKGNKDCHSDLLGNGKQLF